MLDLLISGALVIDGSGAPGYAADVGVAGDRIVLIRRTEGEPRPAADQAARVQTAPGTRTVSRAGLTPDDLVVAAAHTVEAAGRVLAPGFIDVHTHSDLAPFTDVWMDSALRQGVTTVVVGNCGASAWPRAGLADLATSLGTTVDELAGGWDSAAEYLVAVEAAGPACNVATLVGFGSLRSEVMGHQRRPATQAEIDAMRSMLSDALQAGALGLSTGLIYVPDMYASTDEVAGVVTAAAPFDGVYTTHMRAEGRLLFTAVGETLEIQRRAEVHAHISHLKLEGRFAWGRTQELLELVLGGGLSADQYPYTAWETDLASFLPPWASVDRLPVMLTAEETRRRLVTAIEEGEKDWESSIDGASWDLIVLEDDVDGAAGRTIAEVAIERRAEPVDLALDLLRRYTAVRVSGHTMREEDVRDIMARGDIMVGSDGMAVAPDGPLHPSLLHPRSYGTFPRVLGRYARDEGLLALQTAVRKMTGLPARVFGLTGRGAIAEGAAADLVLFDAGTVCDTATYAAPHSYPTGVDLVVVNGRVAWDGLRGERAGRVLRRAGG